MGTSRVSFIRVPEATLTEDGKAVIYELYNDQIGIAQFQKKCASVMLRFTCLAARRELALCSWKRKTLFTKLETHCKPWWWHQRARPHASCAASPERAWHHLRRPSAPLAGQRYRHYSKEADRDTKDNEHPGITVVGIPDPITWIRNKFILFLIELYFGLKFSVEFDSGVKQVGMMGQKWPIKGKSSKSESYAGLL